MSKEIQFYYCKHCKNVAEKVHDSGVDMVCCGEPMEAMVPNTTDAAQEKHVPAVTTDGNVVHVQVGEVIHPMLEEHFIGWICLQTEQGHQYKILHAGEEPKASFAVAPGDKAVRVYEWCNLHGLWKIDL